MVVSGGQYGADQGGLYAALDSGIATCGFAPKGFLTEMGFKPELLQSFNLVETVSEGYSARTDLNIRKSDGTLVVAADLGSPGTKLTVRLAKEIGKPYLWIPYPTFFPPVENDKECKRIIEWINEKEIQTLNVAGNRESVAPGIQEHTQTLLSFVFRKILLAAYVTESLGLSG